MDEDARPRRDVGSPRPEPEASDAGAPVPRRSTASEPVRSESASVGSEAPESSQERSREPVDRRRLLSGIGVGAVMALSGLLFSTSARLSGGGSIRDDSGGVTEALRQSERQIRALETEAAAKRAEVAQLSADAVAEQDPDGLEQVRRSVGLEALAGPGLEVTLTDAPQGVLGTMQDIGPDDLVVHQQDLEGYVNALWAGGAEAMTLQDQRIVAASSFRCAGNTLLLEGRVYSPPFVVRVIGDPERLRSALDVSSRVQVYREWVDYVGLGEEIETLDHLEIAGFDGSLSLSIAKAG